MPDPTRPSREAREAAARLWLRLPDYHRLDRRAEVDIARALDDFAEKARRERDALRERVAELEAAERWLEEHCPPDIVPLEDTHLSRCQFVLDHLLIERKVRGFTAFVLTGDEDGDVQQGAQDMKARAEAAERRVGELELAAEAHETCKASWRDCQPNQGETMLGADIARHWKARAERAEAAIDDVIALKEQAHSPEAWMVVMLNAVDALEKARRARGET